MLEIGEYYYYYFGTCRLFILASKFLSPSLDRVKLLYRYPLEPQMLCLHKDRLFTTYTALAIATTVPDNMCRSAVFTHFSEMISPVHIYQILL